MQGYEPFDDVGSDGLADKDEPGYDPVTNPDPNGDDYHYLRNPTGTENNWRYDDGEPFEDVGLDGVPMAVGGCQAMRGVRQLLRLRRRQRQFRIYARPGELARARSAHQHRGAHARRHRAPRHLVRRRHPRLLQRAVSTNSLVRRARRQGRAVARLRRLPRLVGAAQANENAYDFNDVDWPDLGRARLRALRQSRRDRGRRSSTGDGRHVGTATQAVHRAQAIAVLPRQPLARRRSRRSRRSIGQLADRWPRSPPTTGRMIAVRVILPPGYTQPENASKRYPVVYFLHGYGMDPRASRRSRSSRRTRWSTRASRTPRAWPSSSSCSSTASVAPAATSATRRCRTTVIVRGGDVLHRASRGGRAGGVGADRAAGLYRRQLPHQGAGGLAVRRVATSLPARRCRSRRCWRRPSRASHHRR